MLGKTHVLECDFLATLQGGFLSSSHDNDRDD